MEKYLKARLCEDQIPIPKTHSIKELLELVASVEPLWVGLLPVLDSLTDYAVAVRYPGRDATLQDARGAYQVCVRLRSLARASLGLKP